MSVLVSNLKKKTTVIFCVSSLLIVFLLLNIFSVNHSFLLLESENLGLQTSQESLQKSFDELESSYYELSNNCQSLLLAQNDLESDYAELQAKYDALASHFVNEKESLLVQTPENYNYSVFFDCIAKTTTVRDSFNDVISSGPDFSAVVNPFVQNNTSIFINSGDYYGLYGAQTELRIFNVTNFRIFGLGISSVVHGCLRIQQSSNIVISALCVDGGNVKYVGGGGSTCMTVYEACYNITIQLCTIQNAGYDGANFLIDVHNVRFLNNTVKNCGDDGFNPGGGIWAELLPKYKVLSSDFVATGNVFYNITNDAIHISDWSTRTAVFENTIISCNRAIAFYNSTRNKVYSNNISGVGFAFYEYDVGITDYNEIFGNVVTDFVDTYQMYGLHSTVHDNSFE